MVSIGLPMLVAVSLGGGTISGLWIDAALLLLLAVGTMWALSRPPGRTIPRRVLLLAALPPSVVLLQLVPLPVAISTGTQGVVPSLVRGSLGRFQPITLDWGATWGAFLWTATLSLLLIAMLRLNAAELRSRTPFLFVAIALHMAVALFEFGTAQNPDSTLLGYRLHAGFFANTNHFSALVYASIPLAFAVLGQSGHRWLVGSYVAVALGMLLAAGSRVGMTLGVVAAVGSMVVFADVRRSVVRSARVRTDMLQRLRPFAFAALAVVTGLVLLRVAASDLGGGSRLEFAAVTFRASLDNLPFGTGFGTFLPVYEAYEGAEGVGRLILHQAHNEPAQLLLVGGIPGLLVLGVCATIVLRQVRVAWEKPVSRAAVLGLALIAAHSLVDYPLRTLSVSVAAIFLLALAFEEHPSAERRASRPSARVTPEEASDASDGRIGHRPARRGDVATDG